jgi:hypothetical protein
MVTPARSGQILLRILAARRVSPLTMFDPFDVVIAMQASAGCHLSSRFAISSA